jgi:hypothetical protein
MKKRLLVTILFLPTTFLFSQGIETLVNEDIQYGFNRPRIALLENNVPFVLWGKPGGSPKVYGAKLIGNSFSSPVQIVPEDMNPRVGSLDGPNIVSKNDSIYVVWGNQEAANHHVFLNRSIDGGTSFGSAIQTDSVNLGDNIEYPGVSINNDGTLGIYFIKSDASWNNPTQSLITSYDSGNTFSKDTSVNTFAPGQPCECCQGSMEMKDSNWVFYYRNNVSNVRNVYQLVSTDSGNNFDGVYESDDVDWVIPSCPSSGPEGHLSGNNSFTAWMSKGSGNSRILFSSVNMSTGTSSPATMIDPNVTSNVVQNYPSVAGSGDTIVVVWQDNRYLASNVFSSISIDGGLSFTGTTLISDTSVLISYTSIDVAFANGVFHYVWKNNNKIFYKSMTMSMLLSTATKLSPAHHFKLYPNPVTSELTIDSEVAIEKISILKLTGEIIRTMKPRLNRISVADLVEGIYFIKIEGNNTSAVLKFVKQ